MFVTVTSCEVSINPYRSFHDCEMGLENFPQCFLFSLYLFSYYVILCNWTGWTEMYLAKRMLVSFQLEFLLGSLYPFSLSFDLPQLQMGMHESVYSCIMKRMLLCFWCNFEILCLTSCSQKNGSWARRLPWYVFIVSILALYLAASKNQNWFLWKIQCKWLNPMVTWQHHIGISQIDKCILHE
jgi:hypothetical protein